MVSHHAPDDATRRYIYDANGNRISETDADGQRITSTYDALNRITQTTYRELLTPTGDDLLGHTYHYDAGDHLIRIDAIYSGATGTRTTLRHYDALGRLTQTTDPWGTTLNHTYDPQGNRLSLSLTGMPLTRYGYDALDRITHVITRQGITEYHYDRSSRLTQTTYPQGTRTRKRYDRAGRVIDIEHHWHRALIARSTYDYDKSGNRTQEARTRSGRTQETTYDFDAVDRLTAVHTPEHTTRYTYDATSNRLSEQRRAKTDGTWLTHKTFHYNPRHQVTEVTDHLDPTATTIYTYDASGNRTEQHQGSHTTTYLYDARHHLRQMTRGGSSLGEFLYDWQGMRVRMRTPTDTCHYVYDGTSVVLISDAAGSPKSHYIYGPEGLLALDHAHEGPQYYLFDALGSVVGLSKPAGHLQAYYTYDVWGTLDDRAGASANRFGFTGHELDLVSGLYYAKARYYDPVLGLFISEDPYEGDPLQPLSLHRYLYANSNPTVYVDPTGEFAIVNNLLGGAVSVGIGAAMSWATGHDYGWKDAAIDFGLGFATSGLSAVSKLRHLSPLSRQALLESAELAVDVGAEATRLAWKGEDISLWELGKGAASNAVIGKAGSRIAKRLPQGAKDKIGQIGRIVGDKLGLSPRSQRASTDLAEVIEDRQGLGVTTRPLDSGGSKSVASSPSVAGAVYKDIDFDELNRLGVIVPFPDAYAANRLLCG